MEITNEDNSKIRVVHLEEMYYFKGRNRNT